MKRNKLNNSTIKELRHLYKQIGPEAGLALSDNARKPVGLSAAMVKGWLSGRIQSARPEHLDFVLKFWRLQIEQSLTLPQKIKPDRIRLTDEIRAELRRESQRTGHRWIAVLRRLKPCPAGLSSQMLTNWVSGRAKTARAYHLDLVRTAFRDLPDYPQDTAPMQYLGNSDQPERKTFTPDDCAALIAERERTGIPAMRLLKEFYADEVPDGLAVSAISSWITSKPKTVPAAFFEWVLKAWQSLPDKPDIRNTEKTDYVWQGDEDGRRTITAAERKALIKQRDRTGIYESRLINQFFPQSAPPNLYPSMINGWINGSRKTARSDHLEWTLRAWRSLPCIKKDKI